MNEKNITSSGHGNRGNGPVSREGHSEEKGLHFTRLFPELPGFVLKKAATEQVGAAMTSQQNRGDGEHPAGYTYFGQFIDHDVTRDGTEDELGDIDKPSTPEIEIRDDSDLIQQRSPTLDLDSVYGTPTRGGGKSPRSDGVRFDFAQTTPSSFGGGRSSDALPYDLMRAGSLSNKTAHVLIPDHRNDENLAVAQTHAAWMRFHNHVANKLKATNKLLNPDALFELTRDLVIRHYQHIVLHDFVQRFTSKSVFKSVVINRKTTVFDAVPGEVPGMPLEFSVAAYRFGHSLVRESYEWNRNFNAADFTLPSKSPKIPNLSLFTFTTASGFLDGQNALPSNWIIDWRNFYDFSGTGFRTNGVSPQKVKKIDPFLTSGMGNIPGREGTFNLAAANLRRSGLRNMPSGQSVAKAMGAKVLTKAQMVSGMAGSNLKETLIQTGFDQKTPLWLYILQESAVQEKGFALGEVGSRLVCETFLGLINASAISIVNDGWSPTVSPIKLANGKDVDTMPAMLAWIEEQGGDVINPLT